MNKYTVKGVSDEVTTCQCCGKSNLKRTVAIENEAGELMYFGTTCATAPAKGFGVDREIKKAISDFDANLLAARTVAANLYRKAGGQYVKKDQFTFTAADKALLNSIFAEVWASMKSGVAA